MELIIQSTKIRAASFRPAPCGAIVSMECRSDYGVHFLPQHEGSTEEPAGEAWAKRREREW